jgi:hypothetical protein
MRSATVPVVAYPELEESDEQDTVILRPRPFDYMPPPSPPLPILPRFEFEQPHSEAEAHRETWSAAQPMRLPATDAWQEREQSHTQRCYSHHSSYTWASRILRLPTPASPSLPTPAENADGLASLPLRGESPTRLSRAWSFLSFRAPSLLPLAEPHGERTRDGKAGSASKSGSAYEACRLLGPPTAISDKFTQRWPTPLQVRRRKKGVSGLELELGVGIDMPGLWTKSKWCLLLSVSSVFVYGGAGLVYAILTWFRGESQSI